MSKSMWLRPLAAALGLSLAVSFAACGDDKKDDDDDDNTPPPPTACYDETATPFALIGGANPAGAAGGTVEYAKFATPVAQFEINRSCGVLGTDGNADGVPITIDERDSGGDATLARAAVQALIDAGARAITGVGGNPTTIAAAPLAIDNNVLVGSYIGFDGGLSGCTDAERANPAITKSATPTPPTASTCWDHKGLFFRLSHRTQEWGRFTVARAFDVIPNMTRAAIMNTPASTGVQFKTAFTGKLNEKGITVIPSATTTANPLKDEFITVLKSLTVQNDPEAVFMFFPQTNVRPFAEAYAELKAADSAAWPEKPAHFNSIHFWVVPPTYGTDYSNVSAAALAFLSSPQMESVGVNFNVADPNTAAYAEVLAAFDPTQTIASVQTLRNYDMYMLFALAISKVGATAPATDLAAAVRSIANAPGTKVYANEYEKAKRLILAGEDVDYEGASGVVEFNDRNDSAVNVYNLALIQASGQAIWTTEPILDD